MNKPKLEEFVEPIYNGNRLVAQGINFSKYAFALERYIRELEKNNCDLCYVQETEK